MIKKIIALFCLFVAFGCSRAGGFSASMPIIGMDVGDTAALYIRFPSATECGTPLAYVRNSSPYYKEMLAVALQAYALGKDVRVWVASCDVNNNAVIVRLAMGTVW